MWGQMVRNQCSSKDPERSKRDGRKSVLRQSKKGVSGMNREQRYKLAKARSYINSMANGHWLSDKAMKFTMEAAEEFGDDALWQQS